MKWKWKRPAAFLLAAAMIFTMPGVPASAVEAGVSAVHTGLCEHHPEHTEDCGYTEGTEGADCEHEHTEDCYTLVKKCVHEHDESCYPVLEGSVPENTATPSEAEEAQPTACTHECSEESGCITKELSCPHERGEHDDSCGYIPATEGTPCGYTCYTEKIVIPNSLPEPNLLRTSFQEFGITFLSLAVFPMQKCFEYH